MHAIFQTRSSFLLLLLIPSIVVCYLIVQRPYSSYNTLVSSFASGTTRGGLRKWLAEEEARYEQTLRNRQALIRKWGPTPAEVNPFPPNGHGSYTLWDFFIPAFRCPHRTERVGILGDGGKWVCGVERIKQKQNCVIYSVGVNGESSFEAELLQRMPGCKAWGYDFSVSSWGPEIEHSPDLKSRAHFQPWALGGTDRHTENEYPKYYTLQTIMELNGHDFIDILKIDIESGEFDALTAMIGPYLHPADPHSAPIPLPFGQMQIEIHGWYGHEKMENFLPWWESLEQAGLRPFWTEPNLVHVNFLRGVAPDVVEYSFINARGKHELISDDI